MVFQGFSVSACWHIIGRRYGVTANQRPGVLLSNGMHEAAARNWAMGIVSQPGTMEVVNQTEEMDDVGQPGEMSTVG